MKNNYKLTNLEAVFLIILVMINKLILNIPYYIVNLTGSGSIVNILYIGLIDFIAVLIIVKLLNKFDNADILDVSEFLAGKKLKNIVGILSILLFFLVGFITLVDFSNVLHTIYFYNFKMMYIVIFFIIGIIVANLIGFKSISRTITFIIPFTIISVLVGLLATGTDINIKSLTPILGKDYHTTFVTGLSNAFSMYIIVYFFFLKPLLKNPEDFKKISIISYIISLILLLMTVISMLTIFTTTSSNEPINSLFLLVRQIEFGKFIQRVDSLFILLWIFAILSYLSLIIFIINRILKKLVNVSNEKMLSFSTSSILFGLTLIPINVANIHFIEDSLYRYVILSFIFGIGIAILILANIKRARSKN